VATDIAGSPRFEFGAGVRFCQQPRDEEDPMAASNDRFAGRTVIVTGAGSGIGRATATRLAREGARVVATDIVEQRLNDLMADVEGLDVSLVVGDVSDVATIDALVEAAGERIDGLANVAGIMDAFLPPAEVDDATWERVLNVNLTGPMRLTRAVLPRMIEAGGGSIVNVASEASFRASASGAAYTTSKHAIAGYTKSVAFYYGPQGIRANAVAPGAVLTNIEAPFKSEFAAARVGPILQTVIPAPAQPEQLAAAILWLLSDDSANVNGAILPSDGGWSTI
jgi:NAD(P)-dependent dehydrogenase (short-subunit alcohol dehydrogenase family)